ncbi:hypothetical protein E4634_16590 [Mangrovimicrobium sediminis]|uniref:Tannase/feruloyl esterase family alpha/beta hydrolase n=2 Tax=Mangrovimicrobium sediminis TaxID=2562682 RepID=A0A4Z0LXE3_9GAMM|nr:hypothetical protein E4634_16590 [Haliea sp. SAOS-164]
MALTLLAGVVHATDTAVQERAIDSAGFNFADAMFQQPYVDVDEWRDVPVRHRYVHGGFTDTGARFSLYFPPAKQYQGRFFQYITPVPDSENLSQGQTGESDRIGFAIDSGGYFIETNGGGAVAPGTDPTIGAFRANAATAQFSRHIARQIYGGERPYGYAFGGSGGAFRTVAGMENTEGVWDGAVPYVLGSPMALPNVFTIRTYAMRVLGDDLPMIADRLDVGAAASPYDDLTAEQQAALREATRMGFPPAGWQLHEHLGLHAFAIIFPIVGMMDPTYFDDFWNQPGYEGKDGSPSLKAALVNSDTEVAAVLDLAGAQRAGLDIKTLAGTPKGRADDAWRTAQGEASAELPVALQLKEGFDGRLLGADITVASGAAKDKAFIVTDIQHGYVVLDDTASRALAGLRAGDKLHVDNRRFLAVQTYHRHQVPGPEYTVWDQFRNADGEPIYPQRNILGPLMARGATGTQMTGSFGGKMILVENLHDTEAFPWQGDWYRGQVEQQLGDKAADHFRIWMTDHANHGDFTEQKEPTHTVSYIGVLQQALRDLSAWVERGVEPPANTDYRLEDGQVVVPATAAARRGVQPVARLSANGGARAEVAAGQEVTLRALVDVPPGTGEIVAAQWDLDGSGNFAERAELPAGALPRNRFELEKTVSFDSPGTYFPVLRVASQRNGDAATPFARVQNLARVRVVVKD